MFVLLYVSTTYSSVDAVVPAAKITQEQAMGIADADLRQRLSDYNGIVGILDRSWTRYVPLAEFEQNHMNMPLVYVLPNATLLMVTEEEKDGGGFENKGYCNSGLFAYCGWYDKYKFDYGNRLVYGVKVQIDSQEALAMYMIDATDGKIVDSTFLRSDWIRAHHPDDY